MKANALSTSNWHFLWKPVCSSTEIVLSQWIQENPFLQRSSCAVLTRCQRHGRGQRSRFWQSPPGGVWLSAAMPLFGETKSPGIFGIAVALALSKRLERFGLSPVIKWPNDLLIGERKLAGLLPRIVHRGPIARFARIGLGLNVLNHVPDGGIALKELLLPGRCRENQWTVEVLIALEQAMRYLREPAWVCRQVEERLWVRDFLDADTGKLLKVEGISLDGGLKVIDGTKQYIWKRW